MGIGGLHSCEKSQYINAPDDWFLQERDAQAYYPSIILQQQIAPKNLGKPFLDIYQGIVKERVFAKKMSQKLIQEINYLESLLKTM